MRRTCLNHYIGVPNVMIQLVASSNHIGCHLEKVILLSFKLSGLALKFSGFTVHNLNANNSGYHLLAYKMSSPEDKLQHMNLAQLASTET